MNPTDLDFGNDIGRDLKAVSALHSPPVGLYPRVAERQRELHRRRASYRVAALGVAAVATVGGIVMIQGHSRTDRAAVDQPDAAYSFHTPTVTLTADRITVTVDGKASSPVHASVHGDPGQPNQYTSFELTWTDGVEQRLNIYFASDGTNWWASQIRVYSGQANGWVDPSVTGEFFKSPLGASFHGDLHIANLDITNLTLQAFLTPRACDPTGKGIALIAVTPSAELSLSNSPATFIAGFRLVDVATCAAVSLTPYTAAFAIDDESIASTVIDQTVPTDDMFRVNVHPHAPGTTTLHAVVKDAAGNVVASADEPVLVTP